MTDIFDNIDISASFDRDDLISKLVHRVLNLQAEVKMLSGVCCSLMSETQGLTHDQAAEAMVRVRDGYRQELLVNDPLLVEAVNKSNSEQLGL